MAATRIGFVDDNLDNFHARTYLEALRGPLAARGFEVAGATALQSDAGAAWCAEHEIEYFASVERLLSNVDAVAVLAPSTPETHWSLCERVLPAGKPTFVDKTFAPDATTAQRIFALADRFGAPIQSTSALRTTNVQEAALGLEQPLVNMAVWAGGASWAEYGVHPVELIVSCMGPEVDSVMAAGSGDHPLVLLSFSESRTATISFNATAYVPFLTALTTPQSTQFVEVNDEHLFVDAAAAMLDFFAAGQALVPRAETLAVMRVLDAVLNPEARFGPWKL